MKAIRAAAVVFASVVALPSAAPGASAVAAGPSATLYADGTILAAAARADSLYVGGTFSLLGRSTGSWVAIGADGAPVGGRPLLDGSVTSAVPDGHGGWFLGGKIDAVGSVRAGARLVHLRPSGELDRTWHLAIQGGRVSALARRGSTLFLAGDFRRVGGKLRRGIAAVSATKHRVLSWQLRGGAWFVEKGARRSPAAISTVALANDGRTLYLAGSFNRIGSVPRSGLAEVGVVTGRVTRWNPAPNGQVSTIKPAAGRPVVYVGGYFTRIGKRKRNALAAVDVRTGRSLAFDAHASSYTPVSDLLPTRAAVYVSGSFTSLGGKSRHLVAALDPRTGAVSA